MASTSRSLFLVSLLVLSSCCMTATASRSLQETNKVALVDLGAVLDDILGGKGGLVNLALKVDLSELLYPVECFLEDAAGDLVKLDVVVGLVKKLKAIEVDVTVAGTVNIKVDVLGKEVTVAVKLSELDLVLDTVGDVVHAVLKLVGKVVDGVPVVHILSSVGAILESITGDL